MLNKPFTINILLQMYVKSVEKYLLESFSSVL